MPRSPPVATPPGARRRCALMPSKPESICSLTGTRNRPSRGLPEKLLKTKGRKMRVDQNADEFAGGRGQSGWNAACCNNYPRIGPMLGPARKTHDKLSSPGSQNIQNWGMTYYTHPAQPARRWKDRSGFCSSESARHGFTPRTAPAPTGRDITAQGNALGA